MEFSSIGNVISGIPQGSIFKPLLFNILISDQNERFECILNKFADDTKYGRIANVLDIGSLCRGIWINGPNPIKMTFNKDKCNVLHMGSNTQCSNTGLGKSGSNVA